MNLKIPKHIAIIMDGNGRWANRRGRPRVFGHVRGSNRVKPIVKEASHLGVKALTLYTFSTENWARPESERSILWKLLKKCLIRDLNELDSQNVKLQIIGEIDRLDPELKEILQGAIQRLSQNTGLLLTFALSYGSRLELVRAARLFAEECVSGKTTPSQLTESAMEKYLLTQNMGSCSDVDLFIRTSGEVRISNFLLWQSAYAEFVFSEISWPDFEPGHLRAAIEEYSKRDRRYGGLNQP